MAGGEGGTEVAFDHAVDGFALPALAVDFVVEALFHQSCAPEKVHPGSTERFC